MKLDQHPCDDPANLGNAATMPCGDLRVRRFLTAGSEEDFAIPSPQASERILKSNELHLVQDDPTR